LRPHAQFDGLVRPSDQTHLLLAASVLFCLPMVMLFLIAQRYFVRGIATSGLKG
jgi:ABC-type glycerol-3-phosphate transport system permease component